VQGRWRSETEIFNSIDFHGRNIPKIEFHLPCRGACYLEERVEALFCLDFLLLFYQGKSKEIVSLLLQVTNLTYTEINMVQTKSGGAGKSLIRISILNSHFRRMGSA
jgi:hypothetical protein